MDLVDLEILRLAMFVPSDPLHVRRGLLGPWDIARRLGLHGTTVKARLAAMRENGVLRGLVLGPEPGVLGAVVRVHRFAFPDIAAQAAAAARLEADPRVTDIYEFLGGQAFVGVHGRDAAEADARAAELARELGVPAAFRFERGDTFRGRPPKALDHRILLALVADAHRPLSEVAAEVGVSHKTVRTRLAALFEAGGFGVVPDVCMGIVQGLVPVFLAVRFGDPADPGNMTRLFNAFPEATYRDAMRGGVALLGHGVPDLAAVQALAVRAREVPGVVEAEAHLGLRGRRNPVAIQALLRARLAALEPAALPESRAAPALGPRLMPELVQP